MRSLAAVTLFLILSAPANAQFRAFASVDRLNRDLAGCVVDYTHNHGEDRRIFSQVLNRPRDLYVYLPPGYDARRAYPLMLYFHFARVDEHEFIGSGQLLKLDKMIQDGTFPPTVVICPDGSIEGRNRLTDRNSFYTNGVSGRFEDHVIAEVIPFVTSRYSIRPEREAHAILGASSGGFGALSLAIRHRDYFGSVATLAAASNLLYSNCNDDPLEDFDPRTYRWKTQYDPNEVVGRFYFGLMKVRARYHIAPVFGSDPLEVFARISDVNPANLISSSNLQPGQLDIYVNLAGKDGYNIDAQGQSFIWLAAQRGIAVTTEYDPHAGHTLKYFRRNHVPAFLWLGQRLRPSIPGA
jgi:S-formylglutathione hydrolase FrmB